MQKQSKNWPGVQYPLNNYVYHKLAKFDQNRMIRTTQNFELFYKKPFQMLNILTYH